MMHGWGMGGMGIWLVVVWGTILVGLVLLVRWLATSQRPVGPQGEEPMEVARRRYARGEITRDQFEQLRRDLQGR